MRLIEFFDKGVARDPGRACLIDAGGRRSYAEVQTASHHIANALRRDGVAPGTRAAVYSPNANAAYECLLGIVRAGCVWVTVNPRHTPVEIAHTLRLTGTGVLFFNSEFAGAVAGLFAECPALTRAVCMDGPSDPHPSLADWTAGVGDVADEAPGEMGDLVTLTMTGGTTGLPKGVMQSHYTWEAMVACAAHLLWHEDAVHLVAAPMTHAAGAVSLSLAPMGATQVLLPGFEAEAVMRAIEEYRVTHLFLPPTAIYMMLAHPKVREFDYSSLSYFLYAAAPMSVDKLKEAMDVFGPVMCEFFGQTEAGLHICYMSPEDHGQALARGDDARLASCGRESLFFRVAIMDEDGKILPPDTPGELVIRGNTVFMGYYGDDEATAEAMKFGWFHSGDIAVMDADGWVTIVDRKKDMIISGGFNVFPTEIERVLLALPPVRDCAVVGAPDDKWGEAVTAILELKPGAEFDEAEAKRACRAALAAYKVPKSFQVWPELPRSSVGKVLKREIRARFWEGRARRI